MTLHDAHELGGRVRSRIVRNVPQVMDALIHMEPYEADVRRESFGPGHWPRGRTPGQPETGGSGTA